MKFLQREKTLLAQSRELKQLRAELATLRAQNESMRQGMRRCVSCEYRLAVRDTPDTDEEQDDVSA